MLRTGAQHKFLQPTSFQQLLRTYVLDCSTDNFRELQSFLADVVRNRENFRAGGEQSSGDRIFDSFRAYGLATWRFKNEDPADYSPSSSEPDTPTSLWVEPGTPTSLRSDNPDSDADGADYEPEAHELFDVFIAHIQAQDQVSHMDKCNFWLDCNELARYIKEVYIDLKRTNYT